MHEDALVRQATRTARRVVLTCLAGIGCFVAALAIERVVFLRQQRLAIQQVRAAAVVAGDLLLEDERLTMSATLAAATGEAAWVRRYQAHTAVIDSAIASALRLASNDAAARYATHVKAANDSLVELEARALALVEAHRLGDARSVLASPAYASQKAQLAAGQQRFVADLQAHVLADAAELPRRSTRVALVIMVLALAGFAWLWRRLNHDLARSEAAYRESQRRMQEMARHDALTGMPNRTYLEEHLERMMASRDREQATVAAVVINLDGFQAINDRYGNRHGDAVLSAVAARLTSQVRRGEIAARVGGDEFVVALHGCTTDDDLLRAGQRIIAAIASAIDLPEAGVVRIGASAGVARYPDDATDPADLLRRAQVAMHRAKADRLGGVRLFREAMDADVHQRATLETDLRRAIAGGQIVPFFQPLIDLTTRELLGFEVLARWVHPTRGLLTPDAFIQIAEDTRQIGALTMALLRTALREAASWDASLMLALNIAPQMLDDETLVGRIVAIAEEAHFDCSRLEIEITESAFIRDLEAARRMIDTFRSCGMRVALDDFGTGYSSLSHLSELPFDKIKIDRSFISTMRDRPQSATIVNAIIGLGRSMHVTTTAEGIEDAEHEDALRLLGCRTGQGYLYSRPVPAAAVPALIAGLDEAQVTAAG